MTSSPNIHVHYSETGTRGRYTVQVNGVVGEGELVLTRMSDTLMRADHTFVPETMRGTGAASALVNQLITDARAKGFKIIPQCPYVRAQYARHPDWADVMQD